MMKGHKHTGPNNIQIQYENAKSVESDRDQRIRCLEIAAKVSRSGDADHISGLARRFWSFVREGE